MAAGVARWSTAVGLALALCGQIAIPNARKYSNVDYQFSVEIPQGLRGCMTAAPNPNHGVLILLDGRPCNAPDEGPPYISVNAFYNAAGEAENAAGLAAIQCRWKNARDIVWLKGQLLGGRHAAGCRRRFEDGHIEVSYIVLRRTAQSYLTWIEIGADLVTTPARYQSDMRTFRRVLRGIWIHTDGPQR